VLYYKEKVNMNYNLIHARFLMPNVTEEEQGFHFSKTYSLEKPYEYDPKHVINEITKIKECDYLELGVDQGHTFDHIKNVKLKHGIDPFGASENITHRMTSQMFFSMNEYFFNNTYDLIFIDAIHLFPVVQQEIHDSLKILNDNGLLVLHDTCPNKESSQKILYSDFEKILNDVICSEEKERLKWHENTKKNQPVGYNGDVWKNVAWYRSNTDYTVFSIPDACISIISKKKMKSFEHKSKIKDLTFEKMTWGLYYNCFHQIMNPFTFDYFVENISKELL
jgi:hypothetical protein